MTQYLNYIYIFLGLLAISLLRAMMAKKQSGREDVYEKKRYLLTQAERAFFEVLRQAVGEQYYIFPQVNLDKIFFVKGESWYSNKNRIKQKSVDFLLCDKNSLSPMLAIELNDSSHNQIKRIERDAFVNSVFTKAHLPILFIPWQPAYSIETLRSQIYEIVNPTSP